MSTLEAREAGGELFEQEFSGPSSPRSGPSVPNHQKREGPTGSSYEEYDPGADNKVGLCTTSTVGFSLSAVSDGRCLHLKYTDSPKGLPAGDSSCCISILQHHGASKEGQ